MNRPKTGPTWRSAPPENGEPGGELSLLVHLLALQLLNASIPRVELFRKSGDALVERLDIGECDAALFNLPQTKIAAPEPDAAGGVGRHQPDGWARHRFVTFR